MRYLDNKLPSQRQLADPFFGIGAVLVSTAEGPWGSYKGDYQKSNSAHSPGLGTESCIPSVEVHIVRGDSEEEIDLLNMSQVSARRAIRVQAAKMRPFLQVCGSIPWKSLQQEL